MTTRINKSYLFIFLVALLFASNSSTAQTYFFKNYSVEDGLPFINVSAIFQDSKGNLWSGGYGGLSKFDGISFTNYTPKEGLLNHSVTTILEDNQKNIWIGTISGINKFDGKKFYSYTTKHGLIGNQIKCALKDNQGNLWFGTNKGISKLTDGTFINFSTKDGLINNDVNCIYQSKNNEIWIGTSNGISIFDGKKFITYNTSKGFPANTINCITQDKNGVLFIGTNNGLFEFIENKFKWYTTQNGIKENTIKTLVIDYKNNLWIGTDKGITKKQNGSFTNYSIKRDQNSNLVSCLYCDFENNLWIGTYSGLFKYRGNPFVSYGIHDGLTNNFIYGITRDSKNNLWIGSQGGGVYKYNGDEFIQYNNSGLKIKTVSAIYEFSKNNLWLGTDIGLVYFDGNSFSQDNDSTDVFKNTINCFYKDSKNNIWLGANQAIYKYDGKKFSSYKIQTRSDNYEVWTIVEDKNGNIWFGTYLGGLIKYDGKTFEECSEKIGLENDSYLASLIDNEGIIYWGALDGMWMYNPNTEKTKPIQFNKANGMSSDLVYAMTFDKEQNNIWAGTNQGLNKINIKEYKHTGEKKIIQFGKLEGFSGVECNSNGTWVDNDGSIWFGTVYGLIKYDPSEYIENKSESKISINSMRLFYNDTLLENGVHLHYNLNNITINYNGISLTNPSKVQYSYILEGFEKNWSPPTTTRFATFSNLPSGNYTFKVKSSNNEGVWNTEPATFKFTVDQPFWKTKWFILLLSTFSIVLLILSIRFRINNIKNKEKKKTEINKKIAHLESQALRAQMNPHFIFNTLSSIQHYISNNDTDAALKYLSKFAKLMRKIMDNSKQQLISVAEEIDALNLYLELEVMRFDKKFAYNISIDVEIDSNYDRIPSMLIQPYVENAIIHGLLPKDGAGKISIDLKKQGETILCSIEDNGIGREKSKEYKKNRVQQHRSMGMSITQERLDILNSSLKSNLNAEIIDLYEDGKPSGTKVRLIIPLETEE
ncbi:MAG: histidine kinase [Bacteroidia bacterium]|nr:histidine kinase [Bacteroidia bacterium]